MNGLFKVTFIDPEVTGMGTETHNVIAEDGDQAIKKARQRLFQPTDKSSDRIAWKLYELNVIGWEE